jgi:hypothetical protein
LLAVVPVPTATFVPVATATLVPVPTVTLIPVTTAILVPVPTVLTGLVETETDDISSVSFPFVAETEIVQDGNKDGDEVSSLKRKILGVGKWIHFFLATTRQRPDIVSNNVCRIKRH